jgi:hypothetical protein
MSDCFIKTDFLLPLKGYLNTRVNNTVLSGSEASHSGV